MSKLQDLAERVDRLLLRHAEVHRTNALLQQQVADLTQERDSLRSRLNAARQRIDVLLARLPQDAAPAPALPAAPTSWNGGNQSRIEPTLTATSSNDPSARMQAAEQAR